MTLINRSCLKVTPGLLDFGKNALNSEAKKNQLIILWIFLQESLNLREILVRNYTEELDNILKHCIHLSSDSYVDMITSNFELECHFIMLTTNLCINLAL